jgi:hypothetical protein
MAWRTRLGLLLLLLVLVGAVAAGVLWTALAEAERGLVTALEGKAKAHARIVRSDVELALRLGIPLAELPGAYDYLENGAQADPDIRFVAITDPDLVRLHYGGIGKARLDPLLGTAIVQAVAASVASHPDQPLRAVTVDGFSITPAPLFDGDRHAGFIVVAVQGKQVQEALLERLSGLVPAGLAFLILLLELVAWTVARSVEEPWRRLRRMMRRLVDGRRLVWSGRHDRSELGMAMRLANGIFHRLKDQAERVGMRAIEAERAVFDPTVARAVREHADALHAPPLAALITPPELPADRRPSDVHPAVLLLTAAAALGLVPVLAPALWPAPALPPSGLWLPLLLAAAAGLALALVVRRPGWLLVLAGGGVAAVAIAGEPLAAAAPPLLAGVLAVTLAAGWLHVRRASDGSATAWLVARAVAGLAVGGLAAITLIHEDRLAVLPWLQLGLLGVAVLASNHEPVVRRQLFNTPGTRATSGTRAASGTRPGRLQAPG